MLYLASMKNRCFFLLPALLLGSLTIARAEDTTKNRGLLNSLNANRSLMSKYQNEYIRLKEDLLASPGEMKQKKLKDLEDKIRALEEDAEELQSFLPVDHQAQEFVLDLMTKKNQGEKVKTVRAANSFLQETSLKYEMRNTSLAAQSTFQMHERALEEVSAGNFREAIALYEEIVLRNPDDDEAYLIMGHTYLLMGQYQKAERAFHNAVHIDPENIEEITPFYENTVLQNPDSDSGYANLGYAYLILGNVVKAKAAFIEALRINPANAPAENGMMYLERLTAGS